jgi:hypothetical protein
MVNDNKKDVCAGAQPSKDRATDEELFAIALAAYDAPREDTPWLARVTRAVAARVRQEGIRWAGGVDFAKQEPGLLERLVAAGWDVEIRGTANKSKHRRVKVTRRWHTLVEYTPAADVPATLARLAGLK